MAEEYIPISQLDTASIIDQTNDVLMISHKPNVDSQQYVSQKVTVEKLSEYVSIQPASVNAVGGVQLSPVGDEQLGKDAYVKLTDNNEAYVSVPQADGNTILEQNGKLAVNDVLKDLAEDADNIVKKNETRATVKAIPGKYIAGFVQENGKIDPLCVTYGDLAGGGPSSEISVVNDWISPKITTVPSTALVDDRFKTSQNSLAKVAKTGNYNDLIGRPTITSFQFPIGAIYISAIHLDKDGENWPFDYGEWIQVGKGKCLFGADDNHVVGNEIVAGLPDLSGEFSGAGQSDGDTTCKSVATGVFSISQANKGPLVANSGHRDDIFKFAASSYNEIYGRSDTVQPPALVVEFWKRVS